MKNKNIKNKNANDEKDIKTSKGIAWSSLIAVIFLLIFITCTLISTRVKFLDVKQVGEQYTSVVIKNFENTYKIAGITFLVTYVLIYINNKVIKAGLKRFFDEDKKELPKLPNKSLGLIIGIIAGIVVPKLLGNDFNLFLNASEFGKNDPIFNLDLGYFIFKLPFIKNAILAVIVALILLIIYSAIYYIVTLNKNLDGIEFESFKKSLALKHIVFLTVCIVILFSLYIICYSQGVLTQSMVTLSNSNQTELTGAGSVDVTIKLWGYRILSVVIILSIFRLLKYVRKANFKQGMISACIVPVYMVCMFLAMTYYQLIYVKNNEFDKEKEYIEYNIGNTKEAYNVNINQQNITSYNTISNEEVTKNKDLIDNIPVISKDVILKMVAEHQDNSVYYSYRNTQLANYKINGKNQVVYITPREISSDSDMSYNNRTFKYTHGYSAIVNSASDKDHDGYAEYLLSDFTNTIGNIKITEPRIYFGKSTNSVIAVNTDFGKEYDYPITATNYEENIYKGTAGLNLGFWDRFIVGLTSRNMKLAFSSNINVNTKIISNRNILDRVKSVLPYIEYDADPYLVINETGKLYWVIDGYTVSSNYPYSQIMTVINPNGEKEKINYIRNSVKVIIDAYNGTTKFYITDKTDPIIMVYKNMYPDLFTNSDIPSDIAEHFTYPKYLYNIQSSIIATYHDVSADSIFRSDDLWQITPTGISTTSAKSTKSAMEPSYTVFNTPNSEEERFGLVLTYNKQSKQNIISYLVGVYENGLPKLELYKFSAESNVVGIAQLNNQIEQDPTIVEALEKLNASGTKLTREIKIIPINNTILYVEPVYQIMLNDNDEIPILRKVIVASGNLVAIGNNIEEALSNLFSDYAVDINVLDTEGISAIIDSVIKANNNLKDSLDSNDFEMIGKDFGKLETLLNQLEAARNKEIEEEKKVKVENPEESQTNTVVNSIFNTNTIVEN